MTGQTEDGINFRLLRSNIRTVTGVSPDLNLHHHSHLAHFLLNLSHLIRIEATTPLISCLLIFISISSHKEGCLRFVDFGNFINLGFETDYEFSFDIWGSELSDVDLSLEIICPIYHQNAPAL